MDGRGRDLMISDMTGNCQRVGYLKIVFDADEVSARSAFVRFLRMEVHVCRMMYPGG